MYRIYDKYKFFFKQMGKLVQPFLNDLEQNISDDDKPYN